MDGMSNFTNHGRSVQDLGVPQSSQDSKSSRPSTCKPTVDHLFSFLPFNTLRYPFQFNKRTMGPNPSECNPCDIFINEKNHECFRANANHSARAICLQKGIGYSVKGKKEYLQVKVDKR